MNHSDDELILSLRYVSIQRVVDRLEQSYQKSYHSISLFHNRITTSSRTFLLEHVFDLSYRPFSGQTGLFYLHTREGVFAFEVVEEPAHFISLFKQIQSV
ncbi:hypothetical protein SporoP37_12755 [Sporosarcina sp. P37]|uniref:hypothetical protein n=1 Tax=unclassified Sporosarcina TaxID=2647733 RepID=UPI0009BDC98B|nr:MULTISPECIES: hypothetical protein [unclassified Sporosarcina]ARD48955.1 hypothetical protein SporoP33_12425 [Sporosarcina sp. P33]ARK25440.1 hypothetical protein SporoP37_12755 [Sporosarcina sp. P37]PID19006.1 hypothetical protein CSV62_05215 [Sporosarcina sp. P35]